MSESVKNNCPLISIVIPAYNSEEYIEECLNSVCSQTYKNTEIIIVNDGSLDATLSICEKYAQIDERIRIITQQNMGASSARNRGLNEFKGDYLCFVDADDYIERRTLELGVSEIREHNPDIVLYGYEYFNDKGVIKSCASKLNYKQFKGKEIQETLLPNLFGPDPETGVNSGLWASTCTNLYSRRVIKESDIRYKNVDEVYSEDNIFTLEIYKYISKAVIIPERLYHYRMNQNSKTHKISERELHIGDFYSMCLGIIDKNNYHSVMKKQIAFSVVGYVIATCKNVSNDLAMSFAEKIRLIKKILNNQYIVEAFQNVNYKGQTLGRKVFIGFARKKLAFMCWCLIYIKGNS